MTEKEFYREMMEITISIFAAYTITKDFLEKPAPTFYAVFLGGVLLFVLALFWRYVYKKWGK